jgi:hypothetical protein
MSRFFEAVKQQRVGLACAITVGAVLITLSHAPVIPVITGCVLAFGFLLARAWFKLPSSKTGH